MLRANYQKLVIVGTLLTVVVIAHRLVLWFWSLRWPEGQNQLPDLLVFPNPELTVMRITVISMAEVKGESLWVDIMQRIHACG